MSKSYTLKYPQDKEPSSRTLRATTKMNFNRERNLSPSKAPPTQNL